jgi:hypothetical protein
MDVKPRLVFAAIMFGAALSPGAQACDQRISESFTLFQSNGPEIGVALYQHGSMVTGELTYGSRGELISGRISNGKLTGNHLHFLVTWPNGSVGVYDADINEAGNLVNGTTYNRDKPENRATWITSVTMQCCAPVPDAQCASGRSCQKYCLG